MQTTEVLQAIFRWIHIGAGILWIGLLYFFNFVNGAFAATMDGETKKKVVPQLMPRALYWFRWGAAWTWVTGVLLLLLVFYHGGILFENPPQPWGVATITMIAVTFLGFIVYDILMKTVGKANQAAAVVIGFILIGGFIWAAGHWAGWSYRAYVIHTGALFGTIMAANVWMRIWPAQRKIITAVKNGQPPDPAVVALAGMRSKQNTYLSVPLVWTMINSHTISFANSWLYTLGAVALGWFAAWLIFKKVPKVKGF